jgi:hypothetical protein
VVEWAERNAGPQVDWVRCLGRLDVDVRDRLTGLDPEVRLRAALVNEDDPRSWELILAALADPPPQGCIDPSWSPRRSASPSTSKRLRARLQAGRVAAQPGRVPPAGRVTAYPVAGSHLYAAGSHG